MSWSGTGLLKAMTEEIIESGTILVVSAGNNPDDVCHSDIADIPGVIVVSSVDVNNMHGPTNYAHNKYVDICAPGKGVPILDENNSYMLGQGTSFSAPIVAGVIALMLDVNPTLKPATIERILKESADPIADGYKFPLGVGAGRVNAYKALQTAGTKTYFGNSRYPITLSGNQDISAGYGINLKNVNIGVNSKIKMTARKEVNIDGEFTVPAGSEFTITIDETARSN